MNLTIGREIVILGIVAALALAMGLLVGRTPVGQAIKKGLCDGIKLGLEDSRKHPQEGKTLEELEDKNIPVLPEIQNPGADL